MRIRSVSAFAGVVVAASSAHATFLYGLDEDGGLYAISTTDASTTLIGEGDFGSPDTASLEFNPSTGQLLATTTGVSSRLFSIDPATAETTEIGSLGQPFLFEGALQFAPDGQLWGTNGGSAGSPRVFSIDPITGAATVSTTLDREADINGLAWGPDGLVGLDRVSNALISIDPVTGVTSDITNVPGLVGVQSGMTNATGDLAYFSVENGDLYSVDLATNAISFIGSTQITFTGLAYIPTPSALATLALAGFVGARRRR